MITVTSTISGTYFSAVVPNLSFSITGTKAAVRMLIDDAEIYGEILYPVGGVITMSELSELFRPYAQESLSVTVAVTINELDADDNVLATSSMSCDVVYCTADIASGASNFCKTHFLTILLGEKITSMGRLEYLHYLGADSASCTAEYSDGTTATFTPTTIGGSGTYKTIDVSPESFTSEGKTLTAYTVTAGSRSARFVMDLSNPDCAPILIFVNSFGCEELAYCTGTHKLAPEYTRSTAYISGLQKNYDIAEKRKFTADTGIMNEAMANWFDDIFRSSYVRIVNIYDGTATVGKELLITESKSERTNDTDELPEFTFTYQYAQKNQNVLDLKRAGRIFDNTFDYTFN